MSSLMDQRWMVQRASGVPQIPKNDRTKTTIAPNKMVTEQHMGAHMKADMPGYHMGH